MAHHQSTAERKNRTAQHERTQAQIIRYNSKTLEAHLRLFFLLLHKSNSRWPKATASWSQPSHIKEDGISRLSQVSYLEWQERLCDLFTSAAVVVIALLALLALLAFLAVIAALRARSPSLDRQCYLSPLSSVLYECVLLLNIHRHISTLTQEIGREIASGNLVHTLALWRGLSIHTAFDRSVV